MDWEIIDTGRKSAEENMRLDREFLDFLSKKQRPILHLYDWEGDCATYGHFADPFHFLNRENVKRTNLSLAKRPTGGGIIFHFCDFAFSALVPATHPQFSLNTLENYAFINHRVINAISHFMQQKHFLTLLPAETKPLDPFCQHFCMAKPTKFDVMFNGLKVGGAAQRRTKEGLLHQGTIALALPSEDYLKKILCPGTKVIDAMKQNSYPLLGNDYNFQMLAAAREEMRSLLINAFK